MPLLPTIVARVPDASTPVQQEPSFSPRWWMVQSALVITRLNCEERFLSRLHSNYHLGCLAAIFARKFVLGIGMPHVMMNRYLNRIRICWDWPLRIGRK